MAAIEFTVQDDAGNVIAAPTVEVTREGASGVASPRANRDGTGTLGNPFVGGTGQGLSPGKVRFFITGGAYRVDVSAPGYSDTLRFRAVGTMAEQDVGVAGANPGVRLSFDDDIISGDPGDGNWRANETTFAYITELYISDQQVGGNDIIDWIEDLDNGGDPDHRGYLRFEDGSDPLQWAEFHVKNLVTTITGARVIEVEAKAESGWPFAAGSIQGATFSRTGMPGADGVNGTSALSVVRVVTTENVDLAGGGLAATTVHDGVELSTNNPVLVAGQDAPAENGYYLAPATGAASRDASFDSFTELSGKVFSVQEGDRNKNSLWQVTSPRTGTIDVDPIEISDVRDRTPYPPEFNTVEVRNSVVDWTNDVVFSTGYIRDQHDTRNGTSADELTKRLDADWSAGTGNGMRYSGMSIDNDDYNLYAVWKLDGVLDYYAFPSAGFYFGSDTDPDTVAAVEEVLAALQAETGGGDYLFGRFLRTIHRAGGIVSIIPEELPWIGHRCASLRDSTPGVEHANAIFTAFVMENGDVRITGQAHAGLGQGANPQAYFFPVKMNMPSGLMGKPVEVYSGYHITYVLTDEGDVCACGANASGEVGDNTTTTRNNLTLLDATDIGPRSPGGSSRRIVSMVHSSQFIAGATNTTLFLCADGTMWAIGLNTLGEGGTGTITNLLKPTRCLKIANTTTQATANGTNSSTTLTPSVASKVFTVAAGKSWVAGDPIFIYSHASVAVHMYGTVTSYSGTTLTVNVTVAGTATSSSDWIISELVDDAAKIYTRGATSGCSAYIDTSGKVRFAGHLATGAGLGSAGPGSGTGAQNFRAFRLPKTTSEEASSQLPDDYVATKVVLGTSGISAVHTLGILCTDKNLYLTGYGIHGGLGDGTIVSKAHFVQATFGTAAAGTVLDHIEDAWALGVATPGFVVQLDTGQVYAWGYNGVNGLPLSGTASVNHPTVAEAPFNGTTEKIVRISTGAGNTSGQTCVVALTNLNQIYTWGFYAHDNDADSAPDSTGSPQLVKDPYAGRKKIVDAKSAGYSTVAGFHFLYSDGEAFAVNTNTMVNGELGIGNANGPYQPTRVRFG